MQNISTAMSGDANYLHLQEIPVKKIRADVACFLVPDETYMQAFQTVRDQVIFTNKRVIVVNVQGVTGKKVAYFSYPYAKVQYFGVQTAGLLSLSAQLLLLFANGMTLQFTFETNVDMRTICATISQYTL